MNGHAAPAVIAVDLEKLSAAKFRAAFDLPYLAAALFSLQPVATTDLPYGTMAVDDRLRLYVDPGFVDRCTVAQLAGVLCHEVLHVLMQHRARAEAAGVSSDEEARRWNLAADAAINEVLLASETRSGDPLELPDPVLPVHLGFEDTPGLTAEVMYLACTVVPATPAGAAADDEPENSDDLDGDIDDGTIDDDGEDADDGGAVGADAGADGSGCGHDERDCGSAAHGVPGPWEAAASDLGVTGMAPVEVDLVRHRVAAAVAAHHGAKQPGTAAGGLESWAQELLAPSVDWRTQLRTHIRRGIGLTMGQVVPSYARPSRRSGATGGVILPGMRAPVPAVAVVVDTSGSMSPDDLDDAVAELAGILRASSVRGRQVRVWACDTTAVEVSLRHGLAAAEFPGGGGTWLAAGIEAATGQRNWRPDVIVVLTDGGTLWPDDPPAASVIVGLIGPYAVHSAPPWARTIRIEPTPKGLLR